MAEGKSVDDTILRYADSRSPEEISRMLGGMVSPAQVAAHTKRLLTSRDWLEKKEQEDLAFYQLKATLAELREGYRDVATRKLELQYISKLFDRIDKRSLVTEDQLHTYNANVGRIMGRVVDMALSYMKGALREEVDAAKWDALMLEALGHARKEIAKHEIGSDAPIVG